MSCHVMSCHVVSQNPKDVDFHPNKNPRYHRFPTLNIQIYHEESQVAGKTENINIFYFLRHIT